MIEAALDAGCTASWVTGDEVYGQDPQLRSALEARGVGYVLAVACTTRVRINQDRTVVQVDTAAAALPPGAWHRHITLAMLALAFLAAVAASAKPAGGPDLNAPARSSNPIGLTIPEIRHLIGALFKQPATSVNSLLVWSIWRRRHQAQARRCHYRRRLAGSSGA